MQNNKFADNLLIHYKTYEKYLIVSFMMLAAFKLGGRSGLNIMIILAGSSLAILSILSVKLLASHEAEASEQFIVKFAAHSNAVSFIACIWQLLHWPNTFNVFIIAFAGELICLAFLAYYLNKNGNTQSDYKSIMLNCFLLLAANLGIYAKMNHLI